MQHLIVDDYTIIIIEVFLNYYLVKSYLNRNNMPARVSRGSLSKGMLYNGASLILSLVLGTLIGFTDFPFKSVVYIENVAIVIYLFFINEWSQNKIIGLLSKV